STQWAALKHRGETVAEVRFEPEGGVFDLSFRVPQSSFQIPGMHSRLTTDNLLKAVGLTPEEVESWHYEGASGSEVSATNSELGHPLPPPPQDISHLNLYVRLRPSQAIAPQE